MYQKVEKTVYPVQMEWTLLITGIGSLPAYHVQSVNQVQNMWTHNKCRHDEVGIVSNMESGHLDSNSSPSWSSSYPVL